MLFIFWVTIELTSQAKFKSTVSIMPFKCISRLLSSFIFFFSIFLKMLFKNCIVIVIVIIITINTFQNMEVIKIYRNAYAKIREK